MAKVSLQKGRPVAGDSKAKATRLAAVVNRPLSQEGQQGHAKSRAVHKVGEVNISAYFPADVKASLRMVQAKTGNNVKECLAEALQDLFRKHNVPASLDLSEGR